MSHDHKKNLGFTLIELMLAMGFVSALLIAIALTTIQIGNIYNKGLTMKEVDQAGRLISRELQSGIAQASTFSVVAPIPPDTTPVNHFINEDWGGRLCAGKYSYIWNYGAAITSNLANLYKYEGTAEIIRFARIPDNTGSYCINNPGAGYPEVPANKATELLDIGNRDLVIHTFKISAETSAKDDRTKQQLYYISFSLGTIDQVDVASGDASCKLPNATGSSKLDFAYCAVNYFDIVARTGNNAK